MSKLNSLMDLFVEEIKDLYSAEKQIIAALPKMEKKATDPELQKAFADHLAETRGHVLRLEQVCETIGEKPTGKTCKAMQGLVEEGKEILEEEGDPSVIDAALIAGAQRIEHYEIAGYGCVRTFAQTLGLSEAEELLQETLDEEAAADVKLTSIAGKSVNSKGAQEPVGQSSGRK